MLNVMPMSGVVLFALYLQLAGLMLAVLNDTHIRRKHQWVMLIIVLLNLFLILQNLADYELSEGETRRLARTLAGIFGYSLRPAILVMFFYIVSRRKSHWREWLLVGINAAVYLTALFSGISFQIGEQNNFMGGPLRYTCHVVSAILLLELVWLSVREFGGRDKKGAVWIPFFNVAVIVLSVVLDSVDVGGVLNLYPVTFLTVAVVSCSVLYYIWLHLQFVREHERDLMAEQRIQIMMTQIQPHFLYNTLSVIQSLCRIDPEKAFTTTEKFGAYLRQNLDTLNQPDLIPIRKELEHTRTYAEIESIRFPSVTVEYDIRDESFLVPALSVQPLVENAIRHGVRIRDRGLVTVTTQREADHHEIVIRDNGIGFDTAVLEEADPPDASSHIGIRNVRERVETMCGGTLTVESTPGVGTAATIRLPLKEE